MVASPSTQRICPLCGETAVYDEISDLYYCTHGCDQFIPWLPDRYTAMITGPPGAGKTPVLNAICDFYLRNGRPIVWLAFDDLPANLRGPLDSYCKGSLAEYESRGLATIVDCYSALAGTSSGEKYAMKNRADLNELNLLITEIIDQKLKIASPKILLDSTTPLFNYKDAQLVVQFLTSIGAKIKTRGGALLFSFTSGIIGQEISKRLETTADFVMELQFTEVDGRKKRESRFVKARGIRLFEGWVPFYIGAKTISMDVDWDDPAKYERLKKVFQSGDYGEKSP